MNEHINDIIDQIGDYPAYLLPVPYTQYQGTLLQTLRKLLSNKYSIYDLIVFIREHYTGTSAGATHESFFARMLLDAVIEFYADYTLNPETLISSQLARTAIAFVPERKSDTFADLLRSTFEAGAEVIRQCCTNSDHQIFLRRYGLMGYEEHTLESLGNVTGLTRERVRQKLLPLDDLFKSAISTPMYHPKREMLIHPENSTIYHRLRRIILENHCRVIDATLLRRLEHEYPNHQIDLTNKHLRVLLDLLEIKKDQIPYCNITYYESSAEFSRERVQEHESFLVSAKYLAAFLVENEPGFYTIEELRAVLSRKTGKNESHVQEILTFLGMTECVNESHRVQFNYIQKRTNQCFVLLSDAPEPLSLDELVVSIQSRSSHFLRTDVTERNLANIMTGDDRFEAVGRSGKWTLKAKNQETGTVLEIMRGYFELRQETATAEEVFAYVSSKRDVARNSITIYLGDETHFSKYAGGLYGPIAWRDRMQVWNRESVTLKLREYFERDDRIEIEISELVGHIMSLAQVSERTARGMINTADVLNTRVLHGRTFAKLSDAPPPSRSRTANRQQSNTQQYQIERKLEDLLNAEPTFCLPLTTTVALVAEEFGCINQTVYGVINKSDKFYKLPDADGVNMLYLKDDYRQTYIFIV